MQQLSRTILQCNESLNPGESDELKFNRTVGCPVHSLDRTQQWSSQPRILSLSLQMQQISWTIFQCNESTQLKLLAGYWHWYSTGIDRSKSWYRHIFQCNESNESVPSFCNKSWWIQWIEWSSIEAVGRLVHSLETNCGPVELEMYHFKIIFSFLSSFFFSFSLSLPLWLRKPWK